MAKNKAMGLVRFQRKFGTEEQCYEYLIAKRWPNGFVCPKCGCIGGYSIKGHREYVCKHCKKQSSVTSGTIMHRTHLPLTVWFLAMYLVSTDKRGCSAAYLSRELEISYHTAWFLLHRIRSAMGEAETNRILEGLVQMDEAFYGAPGKNGKHGRGADKVNVLIALSQNEMGHPKYLKMQVSDITLSGIKSFAKNSIKDKSTIITDGLNLYDIALKENYEHYVCKGKEKSEVLQWIHIMISNSKAMILGTFHGLEEKYFQYYLNEFVYRFNRRFRLDKLFEELVETVSSSHILRLVDLK